MSATIVTTLRAANLSIYSLGHKLTTFKIVSTRDVTIKPVYLVAKTMPPSSQKKTCVLSADRS